MGKPTRRLDYILCVRVCLCVGHDHAQVTATVLASYTNVSRCSLKQLHGTNTSRLVVLKAALINVIIIVVAHECSFL